MFGNPGGLLLAETTVSDAINKLGGNTGNAMFQYACWKLIRNPIVSFQVDRIDYAYLRQAIDVLLIPAANQLNPHWDLTPWADLVERLDKPVVIVGLGAQAEIDKISDVVLKPGTARFVKVIGERAKFIGVRGESTQKVLDRCGVHNSVITGCPSNFINGTVTGSAIGEQLSVVKDRIAQDQSLRINYLFGTMEEFSRPCEKALYGLLRERAHRVIYQTNLGLLEYAHSGTVDEASKQYIDWEARVVAPGKPVDEHYEFIRNRGKFYVDAKSWIDEVGRDDLSIGMRIHGAVAAVQGGSLGVCVAFDARTLELATTMGYPYVDARGIPEKEGLRDVMDAVQFSADQFDERRLQLRSALKMALEQEGIITTL